MQDFLGYVFQVVGGLTLSLILIGFIVEGLKHDRRDK